MIHQATRLRQKGWDVRALSITVAVICLAAFGIYMIVQGSMNWQRGIYAGFHYQDARQVAVNALVVQYGQEQTSKMRFATPPVVNTHSNNLFQAGQIRVFHVIGPHAVRYCVTVWAPGTYVRGHVNIGGDTTVQKGCTF